MAIEVVYSKQKYDDEIPNKMNTIGRKVRMLRHKRGWTQEDVAIQMGLSVPAYSNIESGLSDINLSRLERLAGVFDLSVIEILMLDEPVRQKSIEEIATLDRLLANRNSELIELRKEVIELYEKLRTNVVS